ncbi:MAG TPA: N,N-dimethylformamidase beta subunit family domain-containing protein, partial [Acidimicrobiales bacterium]|nr:N,N-dimethylformamidase beta subunit family domain-containing protein [Acidimicrobiales bacterium]
EAVGVEGRFRSPKNSCLVAAVFVASGCAAGYTATLRVASGAHPGRIARAPAGPATFAGPEGIEARWVIAENAKPGTKAWRLAPDEHGASINGFASLTAASEGQNVVFYVTTRAPRYHMDAYRMGYYGGAGGRLIWESGALKGVAQPACTLAAVINMVSCDDWAPSIALTMGSRFPQGDYLFKLVADPGRQSYVPLAVWDPTSRATYVVQNSVLTWQGWDDWGGYDMYAPAPLSNFARVESFDRPYANGDGAADFLTIEFPFVYWAEERGLDLTYWTDVTLAQHPGLLVNHKCLITLGHDETWTLVERNGVIAARARGVNVVFFGAAPVLRHARLAPSPLGDDREEIDYRNPSADPIYATNPQDATGNTWAQPPAAAPPSEIEGESYQGYGLDDPMVVTDPVAWPWAGSGAAGGMQLKGVEAGDYDAYDVSEPNPPNVEILAHSPVHPQVGHIGYSDMTYYTWDNGGGGVLATGTIGWIPALEACRGVPPWCPSQVVRAVTGNILRLFGEGPASRSHPSVANWRRYY